MVWNSYICCAPKDLNFFPWALGVGKRAHGLSGFVVVGGKEVVQAFSFINRSVLRRITAVNFTFKTDVMEEPFPRRDELGDMWFKKLTSRSRSDKTKIKTLKKRKEKKIM
jgi:hypothetical protein